MRALIAQEHIVRCRWVFIQDDETPAAMPAKQSSHGDVPMLRSTAQLMIGTFAALAADPNLSHGETLQKAMLAMIDDPTRPWAKPKFWAPFVVVGEPAKPRD